MCTKGRPLLHLASGRAATRSPRTGERVTIQQDRTGERPSLIEVVGQPLRVAARRGSGGTTPLLLMNGIGAPLTTFEPFINALGQRLEVISFDVPGVGGSPAPSRPYRFRSMARLVARLLDELGYATVDVLGLSWGGALAQQFALSERRRCRRLVLVSTGTGSIMVPGSPAVLSKMVTPRRYTDSGDMARIGPDIYGGSARTDAERLAPLLRSLGRGPSRRGYAFQLLAGAGWTSIGFLPFLRQPTLVLAGDDDPIVPVRNGRVIAGLIRNSRLHVYQGGHVDLIANPQLLAPLIEEFLTAPDPDASGSPLTRGENES